MWAPGAGERLECVLRRRTVGWLHGGAMPKGALLSRRARRGAGERWGRGLGNGGCGLRVGRPGERSELGAASSDSVWCGAPFLSRSA